MKSDSLNAPKGRFQLQLEDGRRLETGKAFIIQLLCSYHTTWAQSLDTEVIPDI